MSADRILVNARSERQFKTQSGYFGYCQISLKTENVIILPIFFCESGGLTRLYCNLAICVKIAGFISLFLVIIFIGLNFRALNSIKTTFLLVNIQCKKVSMDSQKHFQDNSAKTGPFRLFYAKLHTILQVDSSTNRRNEWSKTSQLSRRTESMCW